MAFMHFEDWYEANKEILTQRTTRSALQLAWDQGSYAGYAQAVNEYDHSSDSDNAYIDGYEAGRSERDCD